VQLTRPDPSLKYGRFPQRLRPCNRESALTGPLIYAFLIFLFPLALYCLVLAYVNRSRRPVFVSGLWDAVGLLFALSGFLLWTIPTLLFELTDRLIDVLPAGADTVLWAQSWLIWLGYYLAVALGAALMLAVRRHKTAIYNVDTDVLDERLAVALAELGLDSIRRDGRLIIAPAEAFSTAPPARVEEAISVAPTRVQAPAAAPAKVLNGTPGGPRYAELAVDRFPAFCHATLHWDSYTPPVRRDIEHQLRRALEHAAALENPAAGWFLGFSGLIFGAITLLAAFFVCLLLFARRH
jgi:hypothetical protein